MRLLVLIVSLLIMFFTVSWAAPRDVEHITLANGMQVFVKPDHRAPVVVSQIWYKVGAADERLGETGISHMLEHLMFKGTPTYPKGTLDQYVSARGGWLNAMTSSDFTVYYTVIGQAYLPKVLAIEADRMQHLQLKQASFAKEQQVVIEERRLRIEDKPEARLHERFRAQALIASPYQHPVIGWMRDIEQYTLAQAMDWYKRWYAPNHAVLVVVGDVEPNEVFALAKRYFSKIKPNKKTQLAQVPRIPSLGMKQIQVGLPTQVPRMLLGYRVPSLRTAKQGNDAYALAVLTAVLGQGAQSRLESELVRGTSLANFASAHYPLLARLDNLLVLHAIPTQKTSLTQLQKALLHEVNWLQDHLIPERELALAKQQLIADRVFSQDRLTNQALWIGRFAMLGMDPMTLETFEKHIQAVTAKDCQRVAKQYLLPDQATIATMEGKA